MKKINAVRFVAGLLALPSAADEAERCRNICAVDLKSCRGQAETTAEFEAHPILLDRPERSLILG